MARYNQPLAKPKSPTQWDQLMRAVIARAEREKSPLVPGLKEALTKGKAEGFLRRLGIISENDISREFPPKQ